RHSHFLRHAVPARRHQCEMAGRNYTNRRSKFSGWLGVVAGGRGTPRKSELTRAGSLFLPKEPSRFRSKTLLCPRCAARELNIFPWAGKYPRRRFSVKVRHVSPLPVA